MSRSPRKFSSAEYKTQAALPLTLHHSHKDAEIGTQGGTVSLNISCELPRFGLVPYSFWTPGRFNSARDFRGSGIILDEYTANAKTAQEVHPGGKDGYNFVRLVSQLQ
jgi:hypothetical protein